MRNFKWIYDKALSRHASAADLEAAMPAVKSGKELAAISDDRYLSELSRRIFRAGLKHSMVDAKWPAFEQVFFGFDPNKLVLMSDEALEKTLHNKSIIRHWGKIKAIRSNALMIKELSDKHGGFGSFVALWPGEDIVALWKFLAKNGQQLGGNSAPYFLRMVGKDTFLLTTDVIAALVAQGIVERKPSTQAELAAVQDSFNTWRRQSERPLAHISRMLSYCVN